MVLMTMYVIGVSFARTGAGGMFRASAHKTGKRLALLPGVVVGGVAGHDGDEFGVDAFPFSYKLRHAFDIQWLAHLLGQTGW